MFKMIIMATKKNSKRKKILKRGIGTVLSLIALTSVPHMKPQSILSTEIIWVDKTLEETAPPIPTIEAHSELSIYEDLIREKAQKYNFDPDYIARIIWQESKGDSTAISKAGARGLTQLMPENIERYNVNNPNNPEQNLEAGLQHLRWLTNKFGGNLEQGLAAYNAGQRHVVKALKPKSGRLEKKPVYGGNLIQHIYHDYELRTEELPSETKNYLDKIMGRER